MSYRIVYGPMPRAEKPQDWTLLRVQMWTAVFILFFALLVRQLWPEGMDVLKSVLIPGEQTVTEQALSEMVAGLQEGEHLEDALTAFCRQIIDEEVH